MTKQRRRGRRLAIAVAILAITAPLAACSGDDDEPERPSGDGSPVPSESVGAPVEASLGRVAGDLDKRAGRDMLDGVVPVVDAWIEAAYGGEYPRSDFGGAFAGFTAPAVRRAETAADLLTNADIGETIDTVTFTRRKVVVDTVGRGRRAAGATARVNLEFTTSGDVSSTIRVKGRLLLSPAKQGWKIFGYDIRKGER